jgi:hypothetical protein
MTARRLTLATLVSLCAVAVGLLFGGATALAAGVAEVQSESVSDVASTSATLEATIDPGGVPTSYYFQYGTSASYGSDEPAAPGVELGSGEAGEAVSVHVQGLAAGTTYHFRVVAVSQTGGGPVTVEGPDQTFTTQAAGSELQLLDNRVWEMVTPANKHGARLFSVGSEGGAVIQAAANGDAMSYVASAPTGAEPEGYSNFDQVLSRRVPGGWASQDIDPSYERGASPSVGNGQQYRFFSSDLSLALVEPFASTPLSPEASEETAYLHTDFLDGDVDDPCTSSCYRPLVTGAPGYANVPPGTVFSLCEGVGCGPQFVDATPDLSHVVLRADGPPLTEDGESYGLYEWSTGEPPGEQLQPLYLLPKTEGGGVVAAGQPDPVNHQLSDDGSVFFDYNGHLYLQDAAKRESVRLDVAQGAPEPTESGASFLYASSDGSRVLFGDSQQLTSTPGGGIYECRIAEVAGRPACAQLVLTGLSAEGALVGGSEDASYLYFDGGDLYVDHDESSGWRRTPIATLSGEDSDDWTNSLKHRTSRVSPNGEWLAFMSDQDLTGYDTYDAYREGRDQEVYLYDARTNRLVCPSCDPTGALPVGSIYEGDKGEIVGTGKQGVLLAGDIPGWTPYGLTESESVYQSRYLSNSGRLFFNSFDALVPQDVDGTWDVYEYEPPGEGTCMSSSSTYEEKLEGCVDLVSAGISAEESAFLDASESGGDVFFLSASRLVPQDLGASLEVYDAHECSTPCAPVPLTPPPCSTGDACKPAPTPQPALYGAPSSETFSGAGNIVQSPPTTVSVTSRSTASQKLARALKACRRGRARSRAVCERRARKRYGSAKGSAESRRGRR